MGDVVLVGACRLGWGRCRFDWQGDVGLVGGCRFGWGDVVLDGGLLDTLFGGNLGQVGG